MLRDHRFRHGESYSAEYRAWQTMCHRCTNPASPAWKAYGGRGITVCDRWLNSVTAFIEDMGRKPSPKHELDRVKNDRGYSPDNCRWVLRKVNCRNRRSNRLITFLGSTLTLAEWAERQNLSRGLIGDRLDSGWSPERALTEPARDNRAPRKAA